MLANMGKHFKFRDLEFWAEKGRIHILDHRQDPPDHKTESLKAFLLRAQAKIHERERINTAGSPSAAEEVHELQNCIEAMVQCARIAQHQGDPDDPRARKAVPRSKLFLPTPGQTVEINRPRRLTGRGLEGP